MGYFKVGIGGGSKPKLIGSIGQTINLTSYANYRNFTADNFFIRPTGLSYTAGQYASCRMSLGGDAQVTAVGGSGPVNIPAVVSYNASTGILTTGAGGGSTPNVTLYGDPDKHETGTGTSGSIQLIGEVYLIE